ncbi:MAG: MFS transporter [Gemmatimonadaceae bacterium]|nr:MFS transporter [Gemmatimonadaceae bacterium]
MPPKRRTLLQLAIAAWHTRLGTARTAEYAAPPQTLPQDRIPFSHKIAYGLGAFVNNLLAAAVGGMIIILNLGLGMNPALVGIVGALPRAADAIMDPVMGYISDTTRSRWGRRRPYIFIGAILSGITYAILWMLPDGRSETFYFWYFLVCSVVFYGAYTVFAAPWVALGYELTPDYHERTRLMGVQNFIGQIAYLISPWFLWIMNQKDWFATPKAGAAGLAIAIGIVSVVVGIIPAIVLRERFSHAEPAATERPPVPVESGWAAMKRNAVTFIKGCGTTLRSRPYLKLCAATFLVFNGFIMISSFQSYVIIYYVFGGNQELGSKFAGYAGTLGAVSTFLVIFFITWLATRIGKRKAFFVSTGLSIVGYLVKWFCYNPRYPWLVLLPTPLLAFGLGGLFTLMGSMIADVVDADELETRERREGMFGSIYWWVVKVGMAAALAAGGFLLNATGFDVALGGAQSERTMLLMRLCDVFVPAVTSALAIWAIWTYPISEAKARETRDALEARRGTPGAPLPA